MSGRPVSTRSARAACGARRRSPIAAIAFIIAAAPAALAQEGATSGNAAVLAQQCVSCHGEDAVGRRIPPLMGVDEDHIVSAMEDFRAGRRDNPAMMSIARNLSPQEVQDLADYFAHQGPLAGN